MRWPKHGYVNFLVAECNVARRGITHDHDVNLVGVRLALFIIFLPLLDRQAGAGNIFGKLVGSKTNRVTLKFLAVPLARRIDRGVVAHKLETRINRLIQRYFERMIIDLLQAGNLLGLALCIFFRPFDLGDIACWRKRFFRVHYPGVAPDNIIRRQRLSIVEESILAKFICIDEAVIRHCYIGCKTKHRLVLICIPVIECAVNGFGVEFVLRSRRSLNIKRREAVPIRRDEIDNPS